MQGSRQVIRSKIINYDDQEVVPAGKPNLFNRAACSKDVLGFNFFRALIMVGYLYHCAMPRITMKFASVPVVLGESSDQQGACMHMIQDSGSP